MRHQQPFPGVPAEVAHVRAYVRDALAGLPAALVDDAVLAASELATNALEHTRSGLPGGTFTVLAEVADTQVRIAVTDQGGETEPVLLPPSATRCGGRGLPMLAGLGSVSVSGSPQGRCVAARLPLTEVVTK